MCSGESFSEALLSEQCFGGTRLPMAVLSLLIVTTLSFGWPIVVLVVLRRRVSLATGPRQGRQHWWAWRHCRSTIEFAGLALLRLLFSLTPTLRGHRAARLAAIVLPSVALPLLLLARRPVSPLSRNHIEALSLTGSAACAVLHWVLSEHAVDSEHRGIVASAIVAVALFALCGQLVMLLLACLRCIRVLGAKQQGTASEPSADRFLADFGAVLGRFWAVGGKAQRQNRLLTGG